MYNAPLDERTLEWRVTWILAFPTLVTELFALPRTERELELNSVGCSVDEDSWQWLLAYKVLEEAYRRSYKSKEIFNPDVGNHICQTTLLNSPWSGSLGYGEITEGTVFRITQWIQRHHALHYCQAIREREWCIVDLGSGTGRVLQAAAVCCGNVSRLIGLEIVPRLHEQALGRRRVWKEYDMMIPNDRSLIDLRCSDFTSDRDWIREADLVFVHATVFEKLLMERLALLSEQCRPGTYFCLVSQPLCSDKIDTIDEMSLEMDWGRGSVIIQQRNNRT